MKCLGQVLHFDSIIVFLCMTCRAGWTGLGNSHCENFKQDLIITKMAQAMS